MPLFPSNGEEAFSRGATSPDRPAVCTGIGLGYNGASPDRPGRGANGSRGRGAG